MDISRVYFMAVNAKPAVSEIQSVSRQLIRSLSEREQIAIEKKTALKVHFGEAGNRTFLPAADYDGILDFLREQGSESAFIETNVLYGGKRGKRDNHCKLAADHGFTQLPVVIADGANGEETTLVPIDGKHFKSCSIGKGFDEYSQVVVLAHFKGHALAGFGGAIKQLSMGFASKGGKMAMHLGIKPVIWNWLCKKCSLCAKRCQVDAIHIEKNKSWIDSGRCLGCGACYAACPRHAVSILSIKGLGNMLFQKTSFREKLVEYALAAHRGRQNLYLNFALNITKGCDCEPRPMTPAIADIGIFASSDPVAVDAACLDACSRHGLKFKGGEQLDYADKIGLGSRNYELIELKPEL